ncbi:hypothetical protein [Clostridium felsineum]|uniref:Uncharacterized protein n=1 Tax=Clostridium felsineum TaxID=36839 RepID=A0A1S8MG70_9CLOT|nr:hypothetical protein [Clostridium felsineum]URZ05300.1 hypothetical protein CLROS_006240 [Clostridium felsineum]URZ10341.1 hypothetical protein CROST_010490 [Clostridium felsineum]
MENKEKILRLIMFIVSVIIFFLARYLGVNQVIIISVIGVVVFLIYIRESIKNNYGKIHIEMGVLCILMCISVVIHLMISVKYSVYDICDLIFMFIVLFFIGVISVRNFFKVASKEKKIFMSVLLIIILVGSIFIATVFLLSWLHVI